MTLIQVVHKFICISATFSFTIFVRVKSGVLMLDYVFIR